MLVPADFPPPLGTSGLQVTPAPCFQDACSSNKPVTCARAAWLLWVPVIFLDKFLVLSSRLMPLLLLCLVQPPCSSMSASFPTLPDLVLGSGYSWYSVGSVVVCA